MITCSFDQLDFGILRANTSRRSFIMLAVLTKLVPVKFRAFEHVLSVLACTQPPLLRGWGTCRKCLHLPKSPNLTKKCY